MQWSEMTGRQKCVAVLVMMCAVMTIVMLFIASVVVIGLNS